MQYRGRILLIIIKIGLRYAERVDLALVKKRHQERVLLLLANDIGSIVATRRFRFIVGEVDERLVLVQRLAYRLMVHILVAVDFRPGTVLLLSQSDDQGILGLGKERQSKQG